MINADIFNIEGKNTIVTGAAMGIGFAVAQRFVQAGANVLLADLDERALAAASAKLQGGPGRVAYVQLDVSNDDAGRRAVAKCVESFGSLDVLVNNAGIFPSVPMLKMTMQQFDRIIDVNLRGLVVLSQAAGRHMAEQGKGGRIINIGSVDSLHPSMVGLAAYDASKGGVLMFTRSFALEMAAYNVQVNAVLPGGITTEGAQKPLAGSGLSPEQMAELMKGFTAKIPMRRMGRPDEIAAVTQFLASTAASYMTGASVVVDGGMLLS